MTFVSLCVDVKCFICLYMVNLMKLPEAQNIGYSVELHNELLNNDLENALQEEFLVRFMVIFQNFQGRAEKIHEKSPINVVEIRHQKPRSTEKDLIRTVGTYFHWQLGILFDFKMICFSGSRKSSMKKSRLLMKSQSTAVKIREAKKKKEINIRQRVSKKINK